MSVDRLLRLVRDVDPEPIAELAQRMLETWSPPGHEAEMAAVAHRALVDAGADDVALDEEFSESPSVIARIRGKQPGPTLQWHGHLDAIATPQGPVRRDGDVLHGRGAADMKGALAAEVEAVKLLRAAGLPERGEVLITFHGLHEEGNSAPLHRLIERGIHGDAAIIGELGSPTQLVTGSRGLTFWDLVVTRPGEGVHEQNALPDTVHPVRVGRLLLDRLLDLADGLAFGTAEPRGSLFVGRFNSGDYYNRVPLRAEIGGTRRHHVDATLDDIRDQLVLLVDQVAQESGAEIESRIHSLAEAYEIDPESRVAQSLRLANLDMTGETMAAVTSRATGNASHFVREAGIPAVYYGCNYATAHSDVEQLWVPELAHVAGVFALTTAWFLDGGPDLAPPPLAAAT